MYKRQALGPAPFPEIVRDFQSVIGREAKRQYAEISGGKLPDAVMACIGGGSNAIGMFYPFVNEMCIRDRFITPRSPFGGFFIL